MIRSMLLIPILLLAPMLVLIPASEGEGSYGNEVVSSDIPMDKGFVENLGQWDIEADLIANVPFGHIALTPGSFIYDIAGPDPGDGNVIVYELIGASGVEPAGFEEEGHLKNYLYGSDPSGWVTGARTFGCVRYDDAWENIDISFQIGEDGAKYEFILEPYADPALIGFRIQGQRSITESGGDLVIEMEDGRTFVETGLCAFYLDDPSETIGVAFDIKGDTVGYDIGEYDRSRSMVIDPLLVNSTYMGGSGSESYAICTEDDEGYIYTAGRSSSSSFPTSPGAYDNVFHGYYDAVAFKMDPYMGKLIYSTYFGGQDDEAPLDLECADNGEIVIAGYTNSNDFPSTKGAYQEERNGTHYYNLDIFVLRLNALGTDLVYSTFIGWENREIPPCLVLGEDEAPIIVSSVESDAAPVDSGEFNGGRTDLLLMKLNSNCSSMEYMTYIGGSGSDIPTDTCLVEGDQLYIVGSTNSTDFPVTSGSYQENYSSGIRGSSFIMIYNLTSKSISHSSFINDLYSCAMDIGPESSPVMCGIAWTGELNVSEDAYNNVSNGLMDIYLIKFDANLTAALNSTYFGTIHNDSVVDICVNDTDHIVITGIGGSGFPVTPGAYDEKGVGSVYMSVFSPDLDGLIYSTFLGGSSWERPCSIISSSNDTVIISGETHSANFPAKDYQTTFGGVADLFLSRMRAAKVYLPPLPPTNLTGSFEGNDTIELGWEIPAWDGDRPILGYNISRRDMYGEFKVIGTTKETAFADIDVDTIKTYFYKVHAYNTIGDSEGSKEILVKDLYPPTFNEDLTPEINPTGKDLLFAVNVTDNSLVREVKVVFSYDGGPIQRRTMDDLDGDIYTFDLEMEDRKLEVEYRFSAVDIKSNKIWTEWKTVISSGDNLPIFRMDRTPETVQVLEKIEFSTDVIDNWGMEKAYVEFRTGDGPLRNTSLQRDADTYSLKVGVTGYPGEKVHYLFHAVDIHGNWNSTGERTIDIVDSSLPYLEADLSSGMATTGEPFMFRVLASDDNHVSSVKVRYRITGSDEILLPLQKELDFIWKEEVSIGHELGTLNYSLIIEDRIGNLRETEPKILKIKDNDLPILSNISCPSEVRSGEEMEISCEVRDNIGIGSVRAVYRIGARRVNSTEMSGAGLRKGVMEIPMDVAGAMSLRIEVVDTYGNRVLSHQRTISILDSIEPTISEIGDITTYVDMEVSASVDAHDNLGVGEVTWSGLPEAVNRDHWKGSFEEEGEYPVTVTVIDISNNSRSISFTITVLPLDNDEDGDGIPDLVEVEMGLDPSDGSDGQKDLDSDGLGNFEEFELGTGMDLYDSDSDGMDDGWEISHGMDPLQFNAFEDLDEDGLLDLQEYISGTDPTVFDKEDEKEDEDNYLPILLLVLILGLIVVAFLMLMRKRK